MPLGMLFDAHAFWETTKATMNITKAKIGVEAMTNCQIRMENEMERVKHLVHYLLTLCFPNKLFTNSE